MIEWHGLLGLMSIECDHCKESSNLKDYFHSIRIGITRNGEKEPDIYLIKCPKCKKEMKLLSLNFENLEKDKQKDEKKFCCDGFKAFVENQTNIKWVSYDGIRLEWIDLKGNKSWMGISYCPFCAEKLKY